MVRSTTEITKDLASKNLDKAITYNQYALKVQPDNPILWQRLVTLYLYRGLQVNGQVVMDPRVEEAVTKVVELAPNREESYLNRAQILGVKGDLAGAIAILKQTQAIL
mgnify:CR=1 FL=1